MYGGSGGTPIRSISSVSPSKRMTTVPSSRFSITVAASASENSTRSPTCTRFAGLHHDSHISSSSCRVSRNSIGFFICPFGFAYSRAGITRVSLMTSTSSGARRFGKESNVWCSMCPAPTTIRRERPRMRGSCAMRSGGSSYAKSVRFIDGAAIIRVSRWMRAAPVLLLLGILVIAAPLAAQKNRAARVPNLSRILVVTAHPDDESLFAPILGAYCGVMSECTLLVMTHGENGPCVLAGGCGPDLGATRASELTAAAALLHTRLVLWTLPDVMTNVVDRKSA